MRSRVRRHVSPDVAHARAMRGRDLDFNLDYCRNCLHWLPPNNDSEWGACSLDQHKCTGDGRCALHYPAASEVETQGAVTNEPRCR